MMEGGTHEHESGERSGERAFGWLVGFVSTIKNRLHENFVWGFLMIGHVLLVQRSRVHVPLFCCSLISVSVRSCPPVCEYALCYLLTLPSRNMLLSQCSPFPHLACPCGKRCRGADAPATSDSASNATKTFASFLGPSSTAGANPVVSSSPSGTSKSDASGDTDEASLGHTSVMAAASQATLDLSVRPPPVPTYTPRPPVLSRR